MSFYSFKSEIPSNINSNPTPKTNQKTPPLRNSQAACLKFQNAPQPAEYHITTIATITSIKPSKSSTHLFIFF